MKYHVHVYTVVRVKFADVEADSPQEAIDKAEESVNFHDLLKRDVSNYNRGAPVVVEHVEWAEEHTEDFLVDEAGDTAFKNSQMWHRNPDGTLTPKDEITRIGDD